jgi:hypothetical protein
VANELQPDQRALSRFVVCNLASVRDSDVTPFRGAVSHIYGLPLMGVLRVNIAAKRLSGIETSPY